MKDFRTRSRLLYHLNYSSPRCFALIWSRVQPIAADLASQLDAEEAREEEELRNTWEAATQRTIRALERLHKGSEDFRADYPEGQEEADEPDDAPAGGGGGPPGRGHKRDNEGEVVPVAVLVPRASVVVVVPCVSSHESMFFVLCTSS